MMLMLADSSSSLDAVTYFFTSSGVFIVATAAIFFVFGMLFGLVTWGRYKRKLRRSEESIDGYKEEIAQLKRKIVEKPGRMIGTPATLSPAAAAVAAASPLAALVRGTGSITPSAGPAEPEAEKVPVVKEVVKLPPAQGFSIWTEAGWEPPLVKVPPLPRSLAFTVWTIKGARMPQPAGPRVDTTTHTTTHTGDAGWLYTYEPPSAPAQAPAPVKPPRPLKSQAFTVWTDKHWKPHASKGKPPPPAAGFSIWTLPDFVPSGKGPQMPSQAFSLWTEAGWEPPKMTGVPPRSARSFTVWTEDDFHPAGRGALLPSQAWSVWTAPDWSAPVVTPAPQPLSRAFSVWTQKEETEAQGGVLGAIVKGFDPTLAPANGSSNGNGVSNAGANGKGVNPAPDVDHKRTQGSVFTRALAAARSAFKTTED